MTTQPSTTEQLNARLHSVVWRAEDGGAVIARTRDLHNREVTVKGPADAGPALEPGCLYRWFGRWTIHDKYGRQFEFATFAAQPTLDRRGVIAYLVAVAEGVGTKRAEKLWDRYNTLAIETLRTNPEAVAEAGIMPLAEAQAAAKSLHDEGAFESVKVELLGLFAGRGFQAGRLIKECLRLWGARAPATLRRNPYLLLVRKLPSCGWKRVDRLYLDLGLPPGRLKRQALAAVHHLRSDSSGHTWYPAAEVGQAIAAAVPGGKADPLRALRLAIRAGLLELRRAGDDCWVAEATKAANELRVATLTQELLSWTKPRRSRPGSLMRRLLAAWPTIAPPA